MTCPSGIKAYLTLLLLLSLCGLCGIASADIGVLMPADTEQPDTTRLTMDEVRVQVRIDHQHARVRIVQIFGNHTPAILEGKYVFAIPGDAAISDFAVWDGVVRIPGVILERKRASEIYEQLKMQYIDPGLLQQEEGAEGPRMASAFSARITPIPAYGTKRLEIEYTQPVALEGLTSYFSLPLKPNLFRTQQVGSFSISIDVIHQANVEDFRVASASYPLKMDSYTTERISGSYQSTNIELTEDFAVSYRVNASASRLLFLAYRGSETTLRGAAQPVGVEKPSGKQLEDGYFWLSALINEQSASEQPARSLIILFDISASMHWEKLEQSYRSLEFFLRNLREQDEFQLILFHQEVFTHTPKPAPTTKTAVDSALAFVRSQYLMGGTDFRLALQEAYRAATGLRNPERFLLLITDGNPTLTTVQSRQLLRDFDRLQSSAQPSLRAYCFGIGSDSNRTLLFELAEKSNGHFDWVRETEDLQFKLQAFLAKIGQLPVSKVTLQSSQPSAFYNVYPADPVRIYNGSAAEWYGRYKEPGGPIQITVNGSWREKPVTLRTEVTLPQEDSAHDFIPRGWARKRVDALLRKIELEGEDAALIDEIIALSKKYKFVTPYTSFLAAPRSLLRPRVIRPGDPLLRVRTDPDITAVTVIFPFGATRALKYLRNEDIWQTRFLVPKNMSDGVYSCRLVLQDRAGNQYYEKKSLIVDGRPPQLRLRLKDRAHRGSQLTVVVSADSDTRTIVGRLEGGTSISIEWNKHQKASVGHLRIPATLPPGVYNFEVVAEDFAHNQTRIQRRLEVF